MAASTDSRALPRWEALVDAATLAAWIDHPDLRVFDCRHDLANPSLGREQFASGHLPGARHVNLDTDLSGPKTPGSGRHPLPDRAELARRLGQWGISATTQVVAYDAQEGSFAARLWWMLRWMGHERVAVLDGGLPAWMAAGLPLSIEPPASLPAPFVAAAPLTAVRSVADVERLARGEGRASGLVIDARAADRYEGRNETIDPVGGHIPGAVNRFWKRNLGTDGRFLPPEQLRAEFQALAGGRRVEDLTMQCGSGVTACHNLLAMQVAGLPGAALYPGSWSQWVADPARPVATGPAP